MPIAAGRLRERVVIQTRTDTPDGGGGSTQSWEIDPVTVWARVEELSGGEAFEAMQVASKLAYRITIRNRAVTPQQRVKYGTKILRIKTVSNDERGDVTYLMCDQEDI